MGRERDEGPRIRLQRRDNMDTLGRAHPLFGRMAQASGCLVWVALGLLAVAIILT